VRQPDRFTGRDAKDYFENTYFWASLEMISETKSNQRRGLRHLQHADGFNIPIQDPFLTSLLPGGSINWDV